MRSALTAALITCVTTSIAVAETRVVPNEYSSIQNAIEACNLNGDDILVMPGIYFEDINYLGKAIHIHSQNGWGQTFLDAQGFGGHLVQFLTEEGQNSILDGFTIRNCSDSAVRIEASSPVITNCRFLNNSEGDGGGGIHIENGSVVISNCDFISNHAPSNSGDKGGGAIFSWNSTLTISDTLFRANTGNRRGGAIHAREGSIVGISGCEFEINACSWGGSDDEYFGGSIYINGSTLTIDDSTITSSSIEIWNDGEGHGGAIAFDYSNVAISNTLFCGCRLYTHLGNEAHIRCYGGAIYGYDGSLNLFNCTFADCLVDNNTNGDSYDRYGAQEYYGGAIYLGSDVDLSCENTDFINCKAIVLCPSGDNSDEGHTKGGAIYQSGGSATFTSCEFVACTAESQVNNGNYRTARGGALHYQSCAPQISDCYMHNCSAKTSDSNNEQHDEGWGGAIYLRDYASAFINLTLITGCTATGDGGGIVCEINSAAFINQCQIGSCSAGRNGGALYSYNSYPSVIASVLSNNSAGSSGGGVWGGNGTSLPSCSDVVFCGNTPDAWNPGGIYDDGGNSIAEKCGDDCNENDLVDEYEILLGFADDCDSNGIPDECDIANGFDCNANGYPDACDIADGTSSDCDGNGTPDECDGDCNGNDVPDPCDVADGTSTDCDGSGIPDECEDLLDCNGNDVPDLCDVADGTSADCNENGLPDECDVVDGTSEDCDGNGVPDECDEDCNNNDTPDACDIANGNSTDCDFNGIPDECEIIEDCNDNGVDDACDILNGNANDANGNGVPDECECAGDVNYDGFVNVNDILAVIGAFGSCEGCPEDINGDGIVGVDDILTVISDWGPCPE